MAIYALSDIHGEIELWKQIQEFLTKEDTLVFLGDAIDRGPEGLQVLQEMLSDERVIFLRGNHEQNIIEVYKDPDDYQFLQDWFKDGGYLTWLSFNSLPSHRQANLYQKLQNLPLHATYINNQGIRIKLSHSGFTPEVEDDAKYTQSQLLNKYLYNRKHLQQEWVNCEKIDLIVHDHTPTGFINSNLCGQVCFYCNKKKIDIDTGATFTGVAALLDLDTLTPTYFYK